MKVLVDLCLRRALFLFHVWASQVEGGREFSGSPFIGAESHPHDRITSSRPHAKYHHTGYYIAVYEFGGGGSTLVCNALHDVAPVGPPSLFRPVHSFQLHRFLGGLVTLKLPDSRPVHLLSLEASSLRPALSINKCNVSHICNLKFSSSHI